MDKEKILQETLTSILYMQLLVESLTDLPAEINRNRIKQQSKALIKTIDPVIQVWYDRMFKVDEEITQTICQELESLVKNISGGIAFNGGLEKKVFISQALQAFEKDKDRVQTEIHKILTEEA